MGNCCKNQESIRDCLDQRKNFQVEIGNIYGMCDKLENIKPLEIMYFFANFLEKNGYYVNTIRYSPTNHVFNPSFTYKLNCVIKNNLSERKYYHPNGRKKDSLLTTNIASSHDNYLMYDTMVSTDYYDFDRKMEREQASFTDLLVFK